MILSIDHLLKIDSLDNYLFIKDLDISNTSSYLDIYVQALIDLRKERYEFSVKKFTKIKDNFLNLPIENKTYQDFQYYYYYSKFRSKKFDVKIDILNLIDEIKKAKKAKKLEFEVRLLFILSGMLRDLSEMEFSFACSSLAIKRIENKNINNELKSLIYLNHAVNLTREDLELDSVFFNIARDYCFDLKNPRCKYITLLAQHFNGVDSIDKFDPRLLEVIIDTSYYYPKYQNDIYVQLKWMLKDEFERAQIFIRKNEFNTRNIYYSQLYKIDELLDDEKYPQAEEILLEIKSSFSTYLDSQDLKYLLLYRQMRIFITKYRKTRDILALMEALRAADDSFNIRLNSRERKNGLHIADFVFNNFINELYCLSELNKMTLSKELQSRALWILQKGKTYHKKLFYHKKNLINALGDIDRKKYIYLLKKTNKLESKIKDYDITHFQEGNKLDDIYNNRVQIFEIENQYPEVVDVKDTITIKDLNSYLINSDSQILDYSIDDTLVYITHITKNKISIIEKKIPSSLINILSEIDWNKNIDTQIFDEVSNYLLPKDIQLKGKRNLVIISDGILNRIPFEVLSYQNNSLLENFNVSYLSNIASIKEFNAQKNIIKIGKRNKIFSFSSEESLKNRSKKSIPELPFGYSEAIEINKIYGNVESEIIYTVDNGIKSLFDNEITHFSTHSYSSPNSMFGNYLYTRKKDDSIDKVYGFDLIGLNVKSKNIILSSCESGKGKYKNGSGVFSLARDFLDAGALSVTKSLWKVNEKSTSILMTDYHQNLVCGYTVSEALTRAKRKLKQNPKYAHPYYWAGFVLEGNPNVFLEMEQD